MARLVFAFVVVSALAAATLLVPLASGAPAAKYTVTAIDFKFRNMPKTASPGTHNFILVNKGRQTHDLKLAGKKTKVLKTGQRASITVALKPGKTYAYLCTLPGHAALGMKGKVVTTG